MEIKQTKSYDILDLAKFIFSIFIVAIHSELLPNVLYPWLRLAVPMFFLISSFLFFRRTSDLPNEKKNAALRKTVKRNLILYGIWFIILLPVTLYVRSWFSDGILRGVFTVVKNFFLGSTFLASWFIMANLISIVLIFFLGKKCNNLLLLIVTGILNLLCCLLSAYDDIAIFGTIDATITPLIGSIKNNFVVALFWTALGKTFAEGKLKMAKNSALILAVDFGILLWIERYLNIKLLQTKGNADCFFMLIPTCLFLFAFLLQLDGIKLKSAKFLRSMSTLIYVMHYAVIICVPRFSFISKPSLSFYLFGCALLVSLSAGFCIIKLSNIKQLKFLKYLY